MLSAETVYLGIDVNGRKPTYAVLDGERRLLALTQSDTGDVLAFLGGLQHAIVAINAPPRPNLGLMKRAEIRRELCAAPEQGHTTDLRLADHILRTARINVPAVPRDPELAPAWMRRGFVFYEALAEMGCRPFPFDGADHQWLESNAQASFTVLMGCIPLLRHSLEGRLQRHLLLFQQGLEIDDPMDFFEEITRHKLLRGELPIEKVYSLEKLDALVAALTALFAAERPHQVQWIGDQAEGQVVLPGRYP